MVAGRDASLYIWAYNGGDIFQSGGEIREQVQV